MKSNSMNLRIRQLVFAALCLGLCMVLPFLTGQIPQIGSALSPMHIPVLMCGFICGWYYGGIVGFIAPLLRFMLFGMPTIFPTGIAMAFELAAYGIATGLLYKLMPKKIPFIYCNLIISMLFGRVIWGIARVIMTTFSDTEFSMAVFMSGAFINAVPAIILHIVLIPVIIIGLQKAKLMANE
jgi:Protein of unknown function (DUF1393).